MGKINSRDKGQRGENELSKVLNEYGYNTERMSQYCGKTGVPDVQGLLGIHIECKRVEKLNIETAMEQSRSDARESEIPVVMHRRNHKKWLVTMDLENWIKLYDEFIKSKLPFAEDDDRK